MYKHIIAIAALGFAGFASAGPVNINTADAATLDAELDGVGPVISQRIVEYREAEGGFAAPEQITLVRGIGPRTYQKNVDDIRVE